MKNGMKGFCLTELLLALALGIIVVAVLLRFIIFSFSSSSIILNNLELEQSMRLSMQRVVEMLRLSPKIKLIKDDQIIFIDRDDDREIRLYCDKQGQLLRYKNGGAVPIASYIEKIVFQQEGDILTIILMGKKNNKKIEMRNKLCLREYAKSL